MSYDFNHQPSGMSSGAKVAIGCAAAAFLCIVLFCGGMMFFGFRLVDKAHEVVGEVLEQMRKHVDEFAARFEAQGYQRVSGQVIEISSDIEKPTVYTVQMFSLKADSNASLAVMAQSAVIDGRIDGDLHFYGQSLKISPEAVITGDLIIELAQVVDNRGTVEGQIVRVDEDDADETAPPDVEALPEPDLKPPPGDVIEAPAGEQPAAADPPAADTRPPPPAKPFPADDETSEAASATIR